MTSTIKTDGPELALQNKIMGDILAAGFDVKISIAILANVVAGIIGGSGVPADKALQFFITNATARLQIERYPDHPQTAPSAG